VSDSRGLIADGRSTLASTARGRRARLVLLGVSLVGCAGAGLAYWKSSARGDGEIVARDVPHLEGKWIRYSADFAKRSKIELASCELGSLSPIVSVTGTVDFDPQLVAAIGARIPGRVKRILKYPGDHVKAGEVLAELESAELGQAQTALLATRAHAEAAVANEKRETLLAEQHVSSQRDAELARAGALAAKADVIAAEQKLRALGGTAAGQVGVLELASPIAGKLIDLHVSRGQSIDPTLTAFRVADLSRLWIDLAVFERELGHIREGDGVEISPQTDVSVVAHGKIAHVGDVIELDTRSADVRVVIDNVDGALRPGQSVLAKIQTARTSEPAPLVRLDAVTSIDGKPTVFVAHDETSVEPRTVVLGPKNATHTLITSGLSPGERVVVSGVFPLKAEIFR
jgi:membrane fusion protein, heavy metal efflux system